MLWRRSKRVELAVLEGGTEALYCHGLEAVKESQHNRFAGFQRNVMLPVFRNIQCLHRIGESPLWKVCAVGAFVGAIGSAQAQPEENRGAWQLSAGWQDYSEPQMNLKGPELGVHWQSRAWGPLTLEAEAQLGLQNYSSVPSGRLDSVLNLDTRWRVLRASTAQPQWQVGLALHTHANFLRGTTSLGFGGYDRLSTQVWLPVRWHQASAQPWTVDAGWLLWGQHESRLSQVNTSLQDVTNQQHKGVYFQISKEIPTSLGEMQPYARWTWVDDSDVHWVSLVGLDRGTYEPRNNRLQMGLKWRIR
jgi:hypothetical protein